MLERRQLQRGRTFLGGSISYGYQGFSINCLVRDMSPDGARVLFSNTVPVPSEVDMFIERHGRTRRVRFVWRRDQEAGIVFLDGETKSQVFAGEDVETQIISLYQFRQSKLGGSDQERLQIRIAKVMQDR